MLTQEKVRELFYYKDGYLYNRIQRSNNSPKDKRMDCRDRHGYVILIINRKTYRGHRIIFLYHYGYMPKFIDHIDGNRGNDMIANLRGCSSVENNRNKSGCKGKSSKFKGVIFDKERNKWRAEIGNNYKKIYLGRFKDEIEAAKAYDLKALELFGEFAKLNFPKQPHARDIVKKADVEMFV